MYVGLTIEVVFVNDWAIVSRQPTVRQPSQNKRQSSGRLFCFLSDLDAKLQIAPNVPITATCERRK
jgi:hypothetical protein